MTCSDSEKRILLDQAGELPPALQAPLKAHVEGCARCRSFRQDVALLTGMASAGETGTPGPAEAVRERILAEAAAEGPVRRVRFMRPRQAILAAAAALALLLGYWRLTAPRPAAPLPAASALPAVTRVTEVSSLLAGLVEPGNEERALQGEAPYSRHEIKSMARQLLILQDMTGEAPEDLAENFTPPEETLPTTLRWRNIPGVPEGRCG
jgi:hypothetical protein